MNKIKILLLIVIIVSNLMVIHYVNAIEQDNGINSSHNYNSVDDSDQVLEDDDDSDSYLDDDTDSYLDNDDSDNIEQDDDSGYRIEEDPNEEVYDEKTENIAKTTEQITKNSGALLFVEIFCCMIGIIMIVLANKTTS